MYVFRYHNLNSAATKQYFTVDFNVQINITLYNDIAIHTLGLKAALYMFLENMELEDKMLASADDMTAAEIAPKPKNDTHCNERERIMPLSTMNQRRQFHCFILVIYG